MTSSGAPQPPSRLLTFLVLSGLFALLVGGVAWFRATRPTQPAEADVADPGAAEPSLPSSLTLRPRVALETGGFAPLANLVQWKPNASLQDVGAAWKELGYRTADVIDQRFRRAEQFGLEEFKMLITMSACYNFEGKPDKSYALLKNLRTRVEQDEDLATDWLASLTFLQGVVAFRQGENANCILCRGESSCILPINAAAIHKNPDGSRRAIQHFIEYLQHFPDDLEAKWLLNLAHATLGEHPHKVDPRYLISLDGFNNSEFDIGKFRDVGHLLGINRFNQAPGTIMDDFDNDGLYDLVATSFDPNQVTGFYRNVGDGTFEEFGQAAGFGGQLGGLTCVQTDYNNDGLLDVFIPRGAWQLLPVRPSLMRNDGKGHFTDVTAEAGLLEPICSNAAQWADYDNDGWLDLFICNERGPSRLYQNQGNGTFKKVTAEAKFSDGQAFAKGCTWLDYDNDDYPDLFVNYLQGTGQLHHNNRDGTFTNVTKKMGIDGPVKGFPCWAWDYDNDGWIDVFATCYERKVSEIVKGLMGEPHQLESSRLYRNRQGKGFEDQIKSSGLDMVTAPMGCNYGDFDNDGWLDAYLGTGDPQLSMLIPNRMFKNVSGTRFSEITGKTGTGHLQKGHGVACGDWDRDGDIDLFVGMGGAIPGDRYHNVMFQNPGHGHHWLSVKLVGQKTNRAALGARIKVVTGGEDPLTVHRHVSSGGSFGSSPLEQTIGIGKAATIATLEIHWPTSHTTQVFHDVPVDQAIEITEFAEEYKPLTRKPIPLPPDSD